jgi:hypothetical protein
MLFGCLARFIEGAGGVLMGKGGVFVRLTRKLVGSQVTRAMRGSSGSMGVGGKVVEFGGSVVNALGHI